MKLGEDGDALNNIVLRMDKFVYLKQATYDYIIRENSLSRKNLMVKDLALQYEMALARYNSFREANYNVDIDLPARYCYLLLKQAYISNEKDTQQWEQFIRNNILEILLNKNLSFNGKKQFIMISLGIARAYYKLKYKNVYD